MYSVKRNLFIIGYVIRSLLSEKSLVATMTLTLGSTLGALFIVFAINYTLNFQPLPFAKEGSVFVAKGEIIDDKGGIFARTYNYPSLIDMYKEHNPFVSSTIFTQSADVISSVPSLPKINITYTTPEYGRLFNMSMELGRFIAPEEGIGHFNSVAVISYDTWQDMFGGRQDILSESIEVQGTKYEIVGVVSRDFYEPQISKSKGKTQVWLPFEFNPVEASLRNDWANVRGEFFWVGELPGHLAQSEAQSKLSQVANRRWQEENMGTSVSSKWQINIELESIRTAILGEADKAGNLLFFSVLGILLVALTNLSNMLLARLAKLGKEFGIRATFGANQGDLFVRFFFEILILVALSCVIGLALSFSGLYLIKPYLAELMPMVELMSFNLPIVLTAIFCSLLICLLFSVIASYSVNYDALIDNLRGSGKGTGIQISGKLRSALILSQLVFAMVLMYSGLHLYTGAKSELQRSTGMSTEHVAGVSLFFASNEAPRSETELQSIASEVIERLVEQPEIEQAAAGRAPIYGAAIMPFNALDTNEQFLPKTYVVDNQYFDNLGFSIKSGRTFTQEEAVLGEQLLLVNEAFASSIVKDGSALGAKLNRFGYQTHEVIGVLENVAIPGESLDTPRVYIAGINSRMDFVLKLSSSTALSRAELASLVKLVDPRLLVFNYDLIDDAISNASVYYRMLAILAISLSILVIALVCIGLIGIIGYSVKKRSVELGIRFSIGAKYSDLARMLVVENSYIMIIATFIALLSILGISFGTEFGSFAMNVFICVVASVWLILIIACMKPLYSLWNKPVNLVIKGMAD